MTSELKVKANRANALKSTGPRDTALSRFNALKHGLTAKQLVVMTYENAEDYETLLEELRKDFQPATAVEAILIEQMAMSLWRRQRIIRAERAEIDEQLAYAPLHFDENEERRRNYAALGGYGQGPLQPDFPSIIPSPVTIRRDPEEDTQTNEAAKTLSETAERRKKLYLEKHLDPAASALRIRYESALERQFYRALLMLLKIKQTIGFVSQSPSSTRNPDPT